YFLRPVNILKAYKKEDVWPDVIAGLTVAVIGLPQSMAFALIAELPPEYGLYTNIVGSIVGGLWGSSREMKTGPANAISLLVLSVLMTVAVPGSPDYLVAAGVLAVMAGTIQLLIGLSRLGVLVNFVSHSVIVGFASGAGILILLGQLRHLLGLQIASRNLLETVAGIVTHLPEINLPTALLGVGTIVVIVVLRRINRKLPGPLIAMLAATAIVYFLGLDKNGVDVIGSLPAKLPPLARLPLFDGELLAQLSTGALAVALIGLIQTTAIARSLAAQTGQRLDNNQEFVGQGLANIACGFFSGYAGAGSFSRSVVSLQSGARTAISGVFASLFVLVAMLALAPWAAYLPRTALAGVLIVTAVGLVDRAEIARIWRGARGDAVIMVATFLGTMFLPIESAVLLGVTLSFAYYIMKTSLPRVFAVGPDPSFMHFVEREPDQPVCPQLCILKISGDLYFGAVNHVEDAILEHMSVNPEQRFLLLRLHGVNHCDFSGIYMLENVLRTCKERGGDLFLMKVQKPVLDLMKSTGFYDELGESHFLLEEEAVSHLFYHVLDPAVCIYECDVKVFKECQNLPKRHYPVHIPLYTDTSTDSIAEITPLELWNRIHTDNPPLIIDVREPREYRRGHVPGAIPVPLGRILTDATLFDGRDDIVLTCRSGRRSRRAAAALQRQGFRNVKILQGGLLAWESAGLLEAVEL
ncbi:MAG: sulfate permease, partial [Chloroflexi bacterium]